MIRLLTILMAFYSHTGSASSPGRENVKILPASEVKWEKLNPARGDKSPKAATLWGDRKGKTATGFLVKFVDGFSSPPHIHNVSYRGIVIDGLVHNDDPSSAEMWMPKSSYWTQPAGEAHITSAKGKNNIAFIEIDKGPYLVKPRKQSFDNGERPFNIHSSNIIWRNQGSIKTAELWKDNQGSVTGSMMKFKDHIHRKVENVKLVVIQGALRFKEKTLRSGSLIQISQRFSFNAQCTSEINCIIYEKSN